MAAFDWREQAACTGHPDPDAWFTSSPERMAAATAVCSGCLVRQVCADDAERLEVTSGLWGGASDTDHGNTLIVGS